MTTPSPPSSSATDLPASKAGLISGAPERKAILAAAKERGIEPGSDKQIEVAISDGPTSPEALKALLDPPEAPPPGTGALAGEDQGRQDAPAPVPSRQRHRPDNP